MCGVIGYIGKSATPEFFYHGLKRLEYRGYDSAGIAMMDGSHVFIERAEGKLANLQKKLQNLPKTAQIGIGHTRWATHGKPTEQNAHPHRSENIVLLHNGIIENYKPLKDFLKEKGYVFLSETDTEVAAHLLNYEYKNHTAEKDHVLRMKQSILAVVSQIRGAFAFGILCTDTPNVLYAVKYGSPLVLGIGKDENYMASGITALVEHTKNVLIMEDNEIAILTPDHVDLMDFSGNAIKRNAITVNWSAGMLEKNGYDHFMLKEIFEHPQAVAFTIEGMVHRDQGKIDLAAYGIQNIDLSKVDRIQIIACGTSFYAGSLARYFIERFTKVPVEVNLASEYRYQTSTVNSRTLCIAVSQSGETIDTLQAIKYARHNGAKTLAIVNSPGSTIAHHCHDVSLLKAGPEVGVASTKAFTATISSLMILGLGIAQEQNKLTDEDLTKNMDEIFKVPSFIEKTLGNFKHIKKISPHFIDLKSILFIGRGEQWPIAMEGALKLKELSYIHAEGFAAGELKHGPIALIDQDMFVVCLAPKDSYYEKTMSNIEEIRARGGKIFAIGTHGDHELENIAEYFIGLDECSDIVLPFLTTTILHLFAYSVSLAKGCDVDQPRNLAKSVTVE